MIFLAPILVLIISMINKLGEKYIVKREFGKLSDTKGKFIQTFGLLLFLIIGLFFLVKLDTINLNVMKWFWLCCMSVVLIFQAIIEFVFIRKTREHVVSLISLFVSIIYIFIFMF